MATDYSAQSSTKTNIYMDACFVLFFRCKANLLAAHAFYQFKLFLLLIFLFLFLRKKIDYPSFLPLTAATRAVKVELSKQS